MKIFDYIAIGIALILTVFSFLWATSFRGDSLEVFIEADGKEWIYPLEGDLSFDLQGPAGNTSILISEKALKVIHSDCSEQICVQSGSIDGPGEWIACMPNRIFITIRGKKEGILDGESY